MPDYNLTFDGRSLSLRNQGGDVISSWEAISGVAGHQKPSEQSLAGTGPLPEGEWSISVDKVQSIGLYGIALGVLQMGTHKGSIAGWGWERAWLSPAPTTNTYGRKDFSIHGGWIWGSKGCIDLGLKETEFFATLRALSIKEIKLEVTYDPTLEIQEHPLAGRSTSHCFAAGTYISLTRGLKPIEEIAVDDRVRSFDAKLKSYDAKVAHVFRGVAGEWFILSCGLTVTPGHRFLNEFGEFERIDLLLARGGQIVLEDGSLQAVTAERIVYSEATRHLYAEAEEIVYQSIGGTALQPQIRRGWRTYDRVVNAAAEPLERAEV